MYEGDDKGNESVTLHVANSSAKLVVAVDLMMLVGTKVLKD